MDRLNENISEIMHKQNTYKPSSVEEDVNIDKSSFEVNVNVDKPHFGSADEKPHFGSAARNFVQPSYEGNALDTDVFVVEKAKKNSKFLVDEEHKSCAIPVPNNITRSSEIYLRNVCRLQPTFYTCAVDSFLEIFYGVFSIFIEQFNAKSEFFEIMHCFISQYREIIASHASYREQQNEEIVIDPLELELSIIRQPIWDFLTQFCPSFANRDANAIFSEIFSSNVFNTFLDSEKNLFETSFSLSGCCMGCNENLALHSRICLNYISKVDLNSMDSFNEWPNLLDPLVRNRSLQCRCGSLSGELALNNFTAPSILLVEFHKEGNNLHLIDESISMRDVDYELIGLVRNTGAHFSCAVSTSSVIKSWDYIDDLNEPINAPKTTVVFLCICQARWRYIG